MTFIMSGAVGTAGSNSAAAVAADSNDDDCFPAALPYAHWRAQGQKRKHALHMVQFQKMLADGTTYLRTYSVREMLRPWLRTEGMQHEGFVEQYVGAYNNIMSLKFRPAMAPARTV